jgi:hypothetical protein
MDAGIAAQSARIGKARQVLDQLARFAEGLRSDPRAENVVKVLEDALRYQIPAASLLLPVLAWLSCQLKKRRLSKRLLAVNTENRELAAKLEIIRHQHAETRSLVRCNVLQCPYKRNHMKKADSCQLGKG